jgi:hypothetical protein
MGDFSRLQELPKMYAHCKAFEDKDMTLVDFVTDHLLNIDSVFDKHDNGDEQKPHSPTQHNYTQAVAFQPAVPFVFKAKYEYVFVKKTTTFFNDSSMLLEYHSPIFRPPIFS